jgi:L-prolyl-PCP dehydrogenase
MELALTAAHQELKDAARAFGQREIAPSAAARDREQGWDPALFLRMGAAGFLGAPFPAAYGGRGVRAFELMRLQEGLGEGSEDAGFCFAWGAHTILSGIPLWKHGTEAQRRRYLDPMCRGERIGGLAAGEAAAGSDPGSIQTRAVKRGSRWILDGEKAWVTHAPVGHHFLVTARTGSGLGVEGVSVFIVERGFSGLRVGPALTLSGLRTAPIAGLVLTECEVPDENLLGEVGAWREIGALIARWERTCLLAPWLGLMKATLDRCMQRAKERIQFGRPISHFQAVRTILADMKVRCAVARRLSYHAATSLDAGAVHADRAAAVAKLAVAEHAQSILRDAIQLHGAHGLIAQGALQRTFRDATALTILAGSSELLRTVIAGSLLDLG